MLQIEVPPNFLEEAGLEDYLECESLLRQFFNQVNYCQTFCIPTRNTGCCDNGNCYTPYNHELFLAKKRIEKYGLPEKQDDGNWICDYHTENGCILEDHKPPICIAYLCRTQEEYLVTRKGIKYNYRDIARSLEKILKGTITDEEFQKFKKKLKGFVEKTK